jgi:hypothetical protein
MINNFPSIVLFLSSISLYMYAISKVLGFYFHVINRRKLLCKYKAKSALGDYFLFFVFVFLLIPLTVLTPVVIYFKFPVIDSQPNGFVASFCFGIFMLAFLVLNQKNSDKNHNKNSNKWNQ